MNCCIDILESGVTRGSFRSDAVYLLSHTIHRPDDDVTLDPELLPLLDLPRVKGGLQTVISAAKEEAFNVQHRKHVREAWNYIGQLALEFLKVYFTDEFAELQAPQ